MFLIVLLYALIALTFTIAKISVSSAHPIFFIGIRMITAGSILLAAFLFRRFYRAKRAQGNKPAVSKITRQDLCDFAQVSLFHIFLAFVCEFWALLYLSSVKVNILYSMTPFVAIFLSYILYREKITRRQMLGTVIAFLGVLPLFLSGAGYCFENSRFFALPELALTISVFSATYAWFVIKRLMQRSYSLLVINGISMLIGGVLSLIVWSFVRQPGIPPVTSWQPFLLTLAGLIFISNILVYNLYGWLLQHYSINALTVSGFLSPLFGALYGFIFLGEGFCRYHAIATLGIALGLTLFFVGRSRKQ